MQALRFRAKVLRDGVNAFVQVPARVSDAFASYATARRIAVLVIGGTILLIGVLMLFLPGPGIITAAAGLAILGIEFAFARRWLARVRRGVSNMHRNHRLRNRRAS